MTRKNLFCSFGLAIFILCSLFSCNNDEPIETETPFETVNGFVINDKGEKFLATEKGLYSFSEKTGIYNAVTSNIQLNPVNDLTY